LTVFRDKFLRGNSSRVVKIIWRKKTQRDKFVSQD
jgi:hypothetical protein